MKSSVEETLYIVMPAYNEEENITQVVTSWIEKLKYGSKKSRLVIADSGSNDNTHGILLKLQKKFNQLEIIETTSQYHGPKVIALYKYAVENGADFVFQTDSDGQTDPDEFEKFWQKRNNHDGILGVRKVRGDGKGRAFVEKVVCRLLRIFFGVKVQDANAPFRLMKSELLKKYLKKMPANYELPNIVLTAYFVRFDNNIAFEEISFASRKAGKNSIDFGKIFKMGFNSLRDFWHFRKDMNRGEPKGKFAIMLAFALVAGILIMISSAFPWNGGVEMTDSSVFLTVGRQMENGAMPYVDTFDHKGPLTYIINFFGVMINETKGIFVFEFLAIFVTLWYMFKIFRLKSNNIWLSGVMAVLLFTPFVSIYFSEGGNLTEQYAMPFIAFSIYVFLKYFLEGEVSSSKTFWTGVGFACVLMMRINMVGVWAVFCVGILIRTLWKKEYAELWRYVKWFILGTLSVILPIIIWLLANGAFGAFIDTYIRFNMSYTVAGKINGMLPTFVFFMRDLVIVLSICLAIFLAMFKKKIRFVMIIYILAYAISVLTVCMSGRISPHYGMVLVPLTAFPFAVFCHELSKGENRETILMVLVIVLMSLTFNTWLEVANREVDTLYKKVRSGETIAITNKVCEYVDEYTDHSDKITVFGNWNYVYLRCNRLPASRYSYQFPIGEIQSSIMDEYFDEIEKNKPKVFVVQVGRYNEKEPQKNNERLNEFLKKHGYVEKWQDENTTAKVYVLSN